MYHLHSSEKKLREKKRESSNGIDVYMYTVEKNRDKNRIYTHHTTVYLKNTHTSIEIMFVSYSIV